MNTINTLLSSAHSPIALLLALFVLAVIESLPLVGIAIPGSILLMALGFASASGLVDPFPVMIVIYFGSLLGDTVGFIIGYKGIKLFSEKNSLVARGKKFMEKHGAKSIFLGRFIGPIRPILSLVAGTLGLSPNKFFAWNVIATAVWVLFYGALGFYFGQAWQVITVWSTRISLALLLLAVFALIWWMVKRFVFRFGQQIYRVIVSFGHSFKEAFLHNPYVKKLGARYPKTTAWLKVRLSRDAFSGLPLTLLVLGFLYILSILFGLVEDVIRSEAIVGVDVRVENLLYVFRHEAITQLFLWITVLGKATVLAAGAAVVTLILWIIHKHRQMIGFWVTFLGAAGTAFLGKILIHRPRPAGVAAYQEDSFSFPSGHATMSTVFYGFLIYLYLLSGKSWKQKTNAFFAGTLLIVLICFSRLYLGVHYLSDVLGGITLGLLWLIIGITIIEWSIRADIKFPIPAYRFNRQKIASIILVSIWFAFAAFSIATFEPVRTAPPLPSEVKITSPDILTIFQDYSLSKYTEKLDGSRQEPISFIIAAKDDRALIAAFTNAGWQLADQITPQTIVQMVKKAALNEEYPHAPMTPSFWNAQIHDLGFEKATQEQTVRQRHHARFWNTNLHTPDGKNIYVGTASLDIGLKWFFAHKIAPAIDTERDLIFSDLNSHNTILNWRREQFVDPTLGTNQASDPFFTDGKVYLIEL